MKNSIKYILLALVVGAGLLYFLSGGSSKTVVKIHGIVKKIDSKSLTVYGIKNTGSVNGAPVLMEISLSNDTVVSKRYRSSTSTSFTSEKVNADTFRNDLSKGIVMVEVDIGNSSFPFYKNQANLISYSGPGFVK